LTKGLPEHEQASFDTQDCAYSSVEFILNGNQRSKTENLQFCVLTTLNYALLFLCCSSTVGPVPYRAVLLSGTAVSVWGTQQTAAQL
jgi:hypothetical protein